MRHANGYGAIVKLGGNRRKPFATRITVGRNDKGVQQYKYLGYYETRTDAIYALALYNKGGVSIETNKVTLDEVFEMWRKKVVKKMSDITYKRYLSTYNVMPENLKKKKFVDLRAAHFQEYIDTNGKRKSTNTLFKTLMGIIYNYAMEIDLVQKNQASFLTAEGKEKDTKTVFSVEEKNKLWALKDNTVSEIIIVLLHTGMRINELLTLEKETVFIEEQYFIGGSKTEAGIDRTIPICDKILPIVKKWHSNNKKFLIEHRGREFKYHTFLKHYNPLMDELKMKHTLHETRHTFISDLDTLNVNKSTIKAIVGHAGDDVTEKVYTHKELTELLEAVNKL